MEAVYKTRDERVREILKAAEAMFLDKGYEGTSVRDIARRVGISSALVHRYFPNKATLFAYVCERLFEPVKTFIDTAREEQTALDALHRFMTDYLGFWERNPVLAEFFLLDKAHATRNDYHRTKYIGESSSVFAWVHVTLTRAVKEGTLKSHHETARAETLMYAIDGAMIQVGILRHTKAKKAVAWIEREILGKGYLPPSSILPPLPSHLPR
jgi:AcrR family transcriptional regulator